MTNSDSEKQIVLVGGTLHVIETGPGNENQYEIHSGFGGDYLVDTNDPAYKTLNFTVNFIKYAVAILIILFCMIILFCG